LIVFEDIESVSIQNGCNMHFGVYTAYENGTLKIGDFFSTSRTCTTNFDTNYLDALRSCDNWAKQGKNIVLKNGSKIALSLSWQ
jgi:heat shock protein HslJ